MGKRILIAFDDSGNAMRAVEYVAAFFPKETEITLFSVLPDTSVLCEMNSPELTPYFVAEQSTFCSLENKKRDILQQALAKAKQTLITAGFSESNVSVKMDAKKKGIARDIVSQAQDAFDLVVLGRRGLSGIKEFLLGSISQKVLHGVKDVSILIVN